MFQVSRTMLTLTQDGLLFAGKHVLAPLCPETGALDIETHLRPVMAKLSLAYVAPMDETLSSQLRAAAKAWNRGDPGRAALDLIYVRLPEPKDHEAFCRRLDLLDKAFAAGATLEEVLKAADTDLAWVGEPRTPAGNGRDSGEWTDVATSTPDKNAERRWNAKVKALPKQSLDALKEAMRIEHLPADQFDDMAWIMAQESQGVVGIPNNQGGSATGLYQLQPQNYHFYPHGKDSIGNPVEEAQGGIRYMRFRYGNAAKAKAAWINNYYKNPKNPYW